jgi:hypothetical protein
MNSRVCQPPLRQCLDFGAPVCYDPSQMQCTTVSMLCPLQQQQNNPATSLTSGNYNPGFGQTGVFGPQFVSSTASQQQPVGIRPPFFQQTPTPVTCPNPDYECQAHQVCDQCLVLLNGGNTGDENNRRFLNTMCPTCLKLQQCTAVPCQAREMCEVCKILSRENKTRPYVCSLVGNAC